MYSEKHLWKVSFPSVLSHSTRIFNFSSPIFLRTPESFFAFCNGTNKFSIKNFVIRYLFYCSLLMQSIQVQSVRLDTQFLSNLLRLNSKFQAPAKITVKIM